jgi:hypothetical protein
MRGSSDGYVSVVDSHRKAIEELFELPEGDGGCVETIIGEAYTRIWWIFHRLELRVRWVMPREWDQVG